LISSTLGRCARFIEHDPRARCRARPAADEARRDHGASCTQTASQSSVHYPLSTRGLRNRESACPYGSHPPSPPALDCGSPQVPDRGARSLRLSTEGANSLTDRRRRSSQGEVVYGRIRFEHVSDGRYSAGISPRSRACRDAVWQPHTRCAGRPGPSAAVRDSRFPRPRLDRSHSALGIRLGTRRPPRARALP
jgi:hypothetical protein